MRWVSLSMSTRAWVRWRSHGDGWPWCADRGGWAAPPCPARGGFSGLPNPCPLPDCCCPGSWALRARLLESTSPLVRMATLSFVSRLLFVRVLRAASKQVSTALLRSVYKLSLPCSRCCAPSSLAAICFALASCMPPRPRRISFPRYQVRSLLWPGGGDLPRVRGFRLCRISSSLGEIIVIWRCVLG